MIHGDKKLPNLASEALYVNIQRRGKFAKTNISNTGRKCFPPQRDKYFSRFQ
jgi:hypothetical protein